MRNRIFASPKVRYFSLLVLCAGVLTGTVLLLTRGQAVSPELSPLETRVLGQNHWLRGGAAAVRVMVSDHRNGKPLSAGVRLALEPLKNGKPGGPAVTLFDGRTDHLGTVEANFTAPDSAPGSYQLTASVASRFGEDTVTQPITLDDATQVMLTADKPLYQPGQTIHLRALALNLANRRAVSGKPLTFEIEDARANKVFKQTVNLSKFGLAAADFVLADEVNMGTFTLRALSAQGQAEKKVRVERYVLPKFKLALTTDKPYYLPGQVVKGTVQADYFFGKPVAASEVNVTVSTVDIGVSKLAELQGKTDAAGAWQFEYTLPTSFVGQPFAQGNAVVELHGSVTDTAHHQQEAFTSLPVVKDPIQLVLVPERRELAPGVENTLYIAAATPDGKPLAGARLDITTNLTRTRYTRTTDVLGLATFFFTPRNAPVQMKVIASTEDGQRATVTQTYDPANAPEGIILRTDLTMARVGDRVNLSALSSVKGGTIYLDVIRNRQTILTKALDVRDGQASLALPITPEMTGTLELHAYKILPTEDIIRDTRVLIVSPADDLHIAVNTDKTQYRPGEEAQVTFNVTDRDKHPLLAALGVAVVDESVFALSELQPGLEQVYFTLEKELMEPRYEIHGLKPLDLMTPPAGMNDEARQRAAGMLFAAVPPRGGFDFHVNTYQQRWEKLKEKVIGEMQVADKRLSDAVQRWNHNHQQPLSAQQGLFLLVRQGYLHGSDLRDHWGNFYRTNLFGYSTYNWFAISSAGPDGQWGTADDISNVSRFMGRHGMGGGGFFFARKKAARKGFAAENAPMALGKVRAPAEDGMDVGAEDERDVGAVLDAPAAKPAPAPVAAAPVRLREYFPETMYWNPALITDEHGMAKVGIPLADSITTWRMSLSANSPHGLLGSTTAPLKVFQDFFVDIDLPVSLTQHDRVDIPVAVYNYLPETQTVTLTLDAGDWFTLAGENTRTVTLAKDKVTVVSFPITVEKIGHFSLTVQARGTKLSDAVRRAIDVLPDGKEIRSAISDSLTGSVQKTVVLPREAVAGASTIWVKLFPGAFSQVVDGLDGILRMPFGCFEQTSSVTYPNVLVLDYLKKTKHINPELQMKAEGFINDGYQRLVTFECKNGGFSWFGNEPAHKVLTAYGLLEFSDMSQVHAVDPNVIARTQQWLAGQQKDDGTWAPDQGGIAEGIINRQTGTLRTTAYLAWALAESGYTGPQLPRAVQYVQAHRTESGDPYTQAVILNLLTIADPHGETTANVANALIAQAKVEGKTACWTSNSETFTGAVREGADMETTGLAAYGLAKWGRNAGFTNKALTYLVQHKDSFGTWSSTQGTVWSLKALLYASSHSSGGGKGSVTVTINGAKAAAFTISEADGDVMRQVDLKEQVQAGENTISLHYQGQGSLLYQIVGRYYLPWELAPQQPAQQAPLSIAVAYDKTTLATDDTAGVTVTVKNLTHAIVEMPLIDVGLPPGFTPVTDSLESAVESRAISKYTLAARQIIIYLEQLKPEQTLTLHYGLKAKYPINARTPSSTAYPYYNPEQSAVSAPQRLVVRK